MNASIVRPKTPHSVEGWVVYLLFEGSTGHTATTLVWGDAIVRRWASANRDSVVWRLDTVPRHARCITIEYWRVGGVGSVAGPVVVLAMDC